VEAPGKQAAWEQAQQRWPDARGVVDLDEPLVAQVLLDHLYPPLAEISDLRFEISDRAAPSQLIIYTDGSTVGNPGPAGWAYMRADGRKDSGHLGVAGSNVAELTAVWQALQSCPQGARVTIVTDSRNVVGWLRDGWKRRNLEVKRVAAEIDRLIAARNLDVRYELVTGHAGQRENEEVHRLAEAAARQKLPPSPSVAED